MGIHGLTKLLSDETPGAIKEQELKNLTGRKVAIDASMVMYQFLVAVRSDNGYSSAMLMNEAGEITSHIQGMFNRTIKLITAGVKPVYVFDGKPPDLKGGELAKRMARRQQAEADLAAAKESGDQQEVDKYSRRLVKVTQQHNDDCKELLRLMGIPVITAPCEAEAQCAELARKGKVYATATEDMDALTFHTPKLLRKLTMSGTGPNKQPILEIDLQVALCGLDLTFDQFVDLCILCGCDYCSSIKGIGPKTALKLIRQYKNLEGVIQFVKRDRKKKYQLPKDWTSYRLKHEDSTQSTSTISTTSLAITNEQSNSTESEQVTPTTDSNTNIVPVTNSTLIHNDETDNITNNPSENLNDASIITTTITTATIISTSNVNSSSLPETEIVTTTNTNSESLLSTPQSQQESMSLVEENSDDDDGLQMLNDEDDDDDIEEQEEDLDDINEDELENLDDSNNSNSEQTNQVDNNDEEGELIEPMYLQARKLFHNHEVIDASQIELKWLPPQEEELRKFLVERMGFNPERVENGIKKLVEAQGKKSQQRLDNFFKPVATSNAAALAGMKRKATTPAANSKSTKPAKGGRGAPRR